jgi:hypothetical protein
MEMAQDLVFTTEQHWNTRLAAAEANKRPVVPNPIFAVPLTATPALKFPTNPLLSFQLAAAYAILVELSLLRLEGGMELGWAPRTGCPRWLPFPLYLPFTLSFPLPYRLPYCPSFFLFLFLDACLHVPRVMLLSLFYLVFR